jgi:hypothetical protein
MAKEILHEEASRSWWHGTSTTLCGVTLSNVYTAGWFQSVNCPGCKAAKRAAKAR